MPIQVPRPLSPQARVAELLRALQGRPAEGQGGGMPSLAPPPPGVRMLDWLLAPEAERARMPSGSPVEQILPPGMTSFDYVFDPTAKLRQPTAGRPGTDGAQDLWGERSRSMLFAPGAEERPAQNLPLPREADATKGVATQIAYRGIDRTIGTPQDSLSRWEMPTGDAVTGSAESTQITPPQPKAGPPTTAPVDANAMYQKLGFDPDGIGRWAFTAENPFSGAQATLLGLFMHEAEIPFKQFSGSLPKGPATDSEVDAIRHALWNYRLTRAFGADFAKAFTDAHEITRPNRHGVRLMDLYNNDVGRRLALDPANWDRSSQEVILEALRNGLLQTQPFNVTTEGNKPVDDYNYNAEISRTLKRWFD